MPPHSGFATEEQETVYYRFLSKLVRLLSDDVLAKRKGGKSDIRKNQCMCSLENTMDEAQFEKKIVKIFKAMKLMENSKNENPKFSSDF